METDETTTVVPDLDAEVLDEEELYVAPRVESPYDRPGRWYVVHSYAVDPTPYMSLITAGALKNNVPFKVYSDAAHQHLLGTKSRQELRHKDGVTECLLDVPHWDFHWQQAYWLKTPTTVSPGDQLSIECHWDNSASHQPMVDGNRLTPRDVDWGESTTDEMCLGLLYVSE